MGVPAVSHCPACWGLGLGQLRTGPTPAWPPVLRLAIPWAGQLALCLVSPSPGTSARGLVPCGFRVVWLQVTEARPRLAALALAGTATGRTPPVSQTGSRMAASCGGQAGGGAGWAGGQGTRRSLLPGCPVLEGRVLRSTAGPGEVSAPRDGSRLWGARLLPHQTLGACTPGPVG